MPLKGATGFSAYYKDLFGARWPQLRQALVQPANRVSVDGFLLKPYYLNEASVFCARALDFEPGHKLLDMCAAPGGKALVIAMSMGPNNLLTVNDYSRTRRARLKQVLAMHLPKRIQDQVSISGFNALRWPNRDAGCFDRILLDAPCSSERHVINSPGHLEKWSLSRIKRLAQQQKDMLLTALKLLKPGGTVLYATCALAPAENDQVIQWILNRKNRTAAVVSMDAGRGEPTQYGRHILPDISDGRGPLYMSRVMRIP